MCFDTPAHVMSCACSSATSTGLGPAFWVPAGTSARFILETLAAATSPGLDLTGATLYLRIRTSITGSTTELEATIGDGLTWLDQELGVFIWDILPADFAAAAYTPGTPWYYEFGYTLADGSAYIPEAGIGELYLDKVRPATGATGLQIAWMPYLRARAVGPDGSPTPIYASTAYVTAAIEAALDALFTRTSAANSTGNTTITLPAGSRHHAVDLVFTGAPGTRIVVADTAGAITGDVLVLDYTLPATSDIVVELRDATAAGTLLDTLTTDASADSACIRLTYSGTVWQLNSALYPAN